MSDQVAVAAADDELDMTGKFLDIEESVPWATVTVAGVDFALADEIGVIPMLRYARAALAGVESGTPQGLVTMSDFLEHTLAEGEWARLEAHALATKLDQEGLLEACAVVYQLVAARPTRRPSDSSDGPTSTGASSTASSSSEDFSRRGRGPIMDDPRVRDIRSIKDAARELASATVI